MKTTSTVVIGTQFVDKYGQEWTVYDVGPCYHPSWDARRPIGRKFFGLATRWLRTTFRDADVRKGMKEMDDALDRVLRLAR